MSSNIPAVNKVANSSPTIMSDQELLCVGDFLFDVAFKNGKFHQLHLFIEKYESRYCVNPEKMWMMKALLAFLTSKYGVATGIIKSIQFSRENRPILQKIWTESLIQNHLMQIYSSEEMSKVEETILLLSNPFPKTIRTEAIDWNNCKMPKSKHLYRTLNEIFKVCPFPSQIDKKRIMSYTGVTRLSYINNFFQRRRIEQSRTTQKPQKHRWIENIPRKGKKTRETKI